eukprot:TRINITY_DN7412_c0_g1_i2.p1 TRINITY_DN7412_c0_g1~~TRINITY_DN7412_c0_g1_i2.p1  ORF type:complete len:292 (-),score=47.57 TRINITY_DN7412_c0_g1_i2:567-1406(-)
MEMSTDFLVLHQSSGSYQPRISLACDFCKRLHIKCDGNQNCSNCIKRNLVCAYSTNKRRKPKSKKLKVEEVEVVTLAPSSINTEEDIFAQIITYFIQVNGRDPFFSWLKEVPPLGLVNCPNVGLSPHQLDQKLILLGVLLHGAKLSRRFNMTESIYEQAREIFAKLFGSTSLDYIKGILLLGTFCFVTGKYDESISYLSINNQLLSMRPLSSLTEDLSSMFSHTIGIISATTADREDRHRLFQKGKRLSLRPYDLYKLTVLFTHGEITQQVDQADGTTP